MAGEPLIKVRNLTVRFGTKTILNEVDLDINKNDIFGIVGLSGSGKTTILNTLIGSLEPVSGEVFYKIEPEIKKKRKKKKSKKSADVPKPKAEFRPVLKNLMRFLLHTNTRRHPNFEIDRIQFQDPKAFSMLAHEPSHLLSKQFRQYLQLQNLSLLNYL